MKDFLNLLINLAIIIVVICFVPVLFQLKEKRSEIGYADLKTPIWLGIQDFKKKYGINIIKYVIEQFLKGHPQDRLKYRFITVGALSTKWLAFIWIVAVVVTKRNLKITSFFVPIMLLLAFNILHKFYLKMLLKALDYVLSKAEELFKNDESAKSIKQTMAQQKIVLSMSLTEVNTFLKTSLTVGVLVALEMMIELV
ncbi:hypothetical protein [Weissella halotolerans]|uniref:Uncharacterized protein n=1 Tax=Weissella halotolerans DSM 20190 TaxID=1123500 RepID=A0A0R2G5T8_9LACO|nr:hypothetical protein [Weissella halotolerans]KRN33525.1 hypothetical protein IV68_GL000330 [Weissella halotolerans DSM 20190]